MVHCPIKEGVCGMDGVGMEGGVLGCRGEGWVTTAVLSLAVGTGGATNLCVIPLLVIPYLYTAKILELNILVIRII